MARKTNDEFRKMSLEDMESYVEGHPAEGARAAKICSKTAAKSLEMFVEYQIDRAKEFAIPRKLETE